MKDNVSAAALTSLRDLFERQTASLGPALAYAFVGADLQLSTVMTFGELGAQCRLLAMAVAQCTELGDRVLLAFDNEPDAIVLFWACLLAGRIPVPCPAPGAKATLAARRRMTALVRDTGARLGLCHPGFVDRASALESSTPWTHREALLGESASKEIHAPPLGRTAVLTDSTTRTEALTAELAYLQYTSGSTSEPRGVEITHQAVLAHCQAMAARLDVDQPRGLVWLPWFHDYGLIHGVIQSMYQGCPSYIMPTAGFLTRPLHWLEAIDRYRITHTGAPDFAYAACVQALAKTPAWRGDLRSLVMASCGAEPVRASTLNAFAAAFQPFGLDPQALAPSYGLAEAVLAVTVAGPRQGLRTLSLNAAALENGRVKLAPAEARGSREVVDCGTPLAGLEVVIVDPNTRLATSPDAIGEIWVRGDSVARGYWSQPTESAQIFKATFAHDKAAKGSYLRTGDLGFVHDGGLFVVGRLKDLIIVSGRNIHPQDLERTAESVDTAVRRGGSVAVSVPRDGREVVVLLVECRPRRIVGGPAALADRIARQVAQDHAISIHDVILLNVGALPRTSSGKLQRREAANILEQGQWETQRISSAKRPPSAVVTAQGVTHPRLREELEAVWREVLGCPPVNPQASFFDLGGDSLLATQLLSRLRARFGVDLPLQSLFEGPTLEALTHALAQALDGLSSAERSDEPFGLLPPEPLSVGTRTSLSFSQERMWFMHEMAPAGSAYNMPLAIQIDGPLDMTALQTALDQIIARHAILRTRFFSEDGRVVGEIVDTPRVIWERVRLNARADQEHGAALAAQLAEFTVRPFALDRAPLLRAQAIDLAPNRTVLIVVMHHIVGDQWSFATLARELTDHYNCIVRGASLDVEPLKLQYADYATWHRRWFRDVRESKELAYWTKRLAGLEPVAFPRDKDQPRTPNHLGRCVKISLDEGLLAQLRRASSRRDSSLSMVLMAALSIVLMRHSGRSDIAFGMPIANRQHLATEALIGTFVNTLVLRTDVQPSDSFDGVMSRVRAAALEAHAHQSMPFELLVQSLQERAGPGRPPLFNVLFNMINAPARGLQFDGAEWSRVDFDRQRAQFDLTVIADPDHDRSILLEYATELFHHSTIERLARHLEITLRCIGLDEASPVGNWPLLDPLERETLRRWGSGPAVPLAADTVVGWMALHRVDQRAERTALVCRGEAWSYAALHAAANRWARRLRRQGIARGSRVGLALRRGHSLVAALLGVLRAGAAYVPLDPDYPLERLSHQISDANLTAIVGEGAFLDDLDTAQVRRLPADRMAEELALEAAEDLPADADLDARATDPAYIIYTSGSTGLPKGVVVPHRAVANFLASVAKRPGIGPEDTMLAVTTVGFDIAVLELLLPLGVGACVVLATEEEGQDGSTLARLLRESGATVMQATPSRWHLMLEAGWSGTAELRGLVGGEPLTAALAADLLARCGEVWNMYGPTETTVWSSRWRVTAESLPAIALGEPLDNTLIEVRDARGQVAPVGVPGEICIGGLGVANGYHNRPTLTAERFIEADEPEARIYRTGDLGRWHHDGRLEHLGRIDDQVKFRGFRIEPGEIEARLEEHPGVGRAVVTVREDRENDPRLVAYVIPKGGAKTPIDDLRQHLRRWLPEHMLPTAVVHLDALPLLANGKTNRRALPAPAATSVGSPALKAPPVTPEEQQVWAVWSEVLQQSAIGIHDNFFDLGGHSLLAIRAAGLIEKRMNRPCPLRLLFDLPTIASLAAELAKQGPPSLGATRCVATLQPRGSGAGLFLLAGADIYRDLARHLGDDFPVYGLFSQAEIDLVDRPTAPGTPPLDIQAMAGDYLNLIRSVQPQGPYVMGGFSIGGILAFEVAQRLRQAGERVALLILLDSMLPGRGWRHLLAGLRRRWRLIRRDGVGHLWHVLRVLHREHVQRDDPGQRRIVQYAEAIQRYQPAASDVPVLFLQAGDDPSTDVAYGWGVHLAQMTVHRVPGRHMDILAAPGVRELAAHIRTQMLARRASTPPANTLPESRPPSCA